MKHIAWTEIMLFHNLLISLKKYGPIKEIPNVIVGGRVSDFEGYVNIFMCDSFYNKLKELDYLKYIEHRVFNKDQDLLKEENIKEFRDKEYTWCVDIQAVLNTIKLPDDFMQFLFDNLQVIAYDLASQFQDLSVDIVKKNFINLDLNLLLINKNLNYESKEFVKNHIELL